MIEFINVCKSYNKHKILNNITFKIENNEKVAIIGESGKGKTTILNIIGLLENYDNGTYLLENKDMFSLKRKDKLNIFKSKIGYLFQNFALIDDDSVLNNLLMCLEGNKKDNIIKINEALKEVGLESKINNKVYQLSGGEQQRVAIARLILKDCDLILADEPTGSLDEKNTKLVLSLLEKLYKKGKTLVIVTHDMRVAKFCNKIYRL